MSEKAEKTYLVSPEGAWNFGVWVGIAAIGSSIVLGIAWNSAADNAEEECYRTIGQSELVQSGTHRVAYSANGTFWAEQGCYLEPL